MTENHWVLKLSGRQCLSDESVYRVAGVLIEINEPEGKKRATVFERVTGEDLLCNASRAWFCLLGIVEREPDNSGRYTFLVAVELAHFHLRTQFAMFDRHPAQRDVFPEFG